MAKTQNTPGVRRSSRGKGNTSPSKSSSATGNNSPVTKGGKKAVLKSGNTKLLADKPHGNINDNDALTPNTKNPPKEDFVMEDPNETAKPSEKPPEQSTFKSVLIDTIDKPMFDSSKLSTFLLHKLVYDRQHGQDANLSDDSTVGHENSSSHDFSNSVRMTMMFKLPIKQEECSDNDAPITAIKKMNLMIKTLTNKLPCRVGPWIMNKGASALTEKDLYKVLPEDIDFVESYVFDYNRFLSPGKTGYVRLHIFYSDLTSLPEIQGIVSQFKKPREQFLEVAHSNATSPINIGTLTGSVKAMAFSSDFYNVMKEKFGLSELGLWFTQPRTSKSGEFNTDKFVLHMEIDRKDLPKRLEMEQYFNHSPSGIDNAFFGTPMLLARPFDYSADDDVKASIDNHARKQLRLGNSLRSTVVTGVQLCNWSNSSKTSTLLRDLMEVESITSKKIMKGKSTTSFKGRVFYSIIPDKNSSTFYYTRANFNEGRSIARGLPLFIRDHFKLDPAFFCSSDTLTTALEGEWDYATRKFQSAAEKIESAKLDLMECEAIAEVEQFISKEQQLAMATDKDDVSVETRLTKGDAVPPPADTDDISDMTGSTRESKANAYAAKAAKEVAAQYTTTINSMKADMGDKDNEIAELKLLLQQLRKDNGHPEGSNQSDKRQGYLEQDATSRTKKFRANEPHNPDSQKDNNSKGNQDSSSQADDMSL